MNYGRPVLVASALLALVLTACTRPEAPAAADRSLQVRNPKLRIERVTQERPAAFDRVLLAPIELEFREVAPLAGPSGSTQNRTEFPVGERERQQLAAVFDERLRKELADNPRLTLAEAPGPGVLVVKPALRDIVSRVPPEEPPGRGDIYLDSVGEATLVVQFVDGTRGAVIGTASDRRRAEPAGTLGGFGGVRANPVETGREIRLLAQRWARSLERRIEQLYFEAKPR
jgi:hypothetical protein